MPIFNLQHHCFSPIPLIGFQRKSTCYLIIASMNLIWGMYLQSRLKKTWILLVFKATIWGIFCELMYYNARIAVGQPCMFVLSHDQGYCSFCGCLFLLSKNCSYVNASFCSSPFSLTSQSVIAPLTRPCWTIYISSSPSSGKESPVFPGSTEHGPRLRPPGPSSPYSQRRTEAPWPRRTPCRPRRASSRPWRRRRGPLRWPLPRSWQRPRVPSRKHFRSCCGTWWAGSSSNLSHLVDICCCCFVPRCCGGSRTHRTRRFLLFSRWARRGLCRSGVAGWWAHPWKSASNLTWLRKISYLICLTKHWPETYIFIVQITYTSVFDRNIVLFSIYNHVHTILSTFIKYFRSGFIWIQVWF